MLVALALPGAAAAAAGQSAERCLHLGSPCAPSMLRPCCDGAAQAAAPAILSVTAWSSVWRLHANTQRNAGPEYLRHDLQGHAQWRLALLHPPSPPDVDPARLLTVLLI